MFFRRQNTAQPLHAIVGLDVTGAGPGDPVSIRIVGTPEIKHVVEHKPYPHPTRGEVRMIDQNGLPFWIGSINCYGGAYNSINVPIAGRVEGVPVSAPPLRLEFSWEYDR